jgi:chaperone modulatory protein CbpM
MRYEIVEEETRLTLVELCRACDVSTEAVAELVSQGVLDPYGRSPQDWLFAGDNLSRARRALRLIRELGVNPAGAAVALELIEQIERLQARLDTPGP